MELKKKVKKAKKELRTRKPTDLIKWLEKEKEELLNDKEVYRL